MRAPSAKTQPLGYKAVRSAARRGFTTYGLAGCSQLREAKKQGWLSSNGVKRGDPRYTLTPKGRKLAREQGWFGRGR